MSFIEKALKNFEKIGEISSYGYIKTDEEITEEIHLLDEEMKKMTKKKDEINHFNQ